MTDTYGPDLKSLNRSYDDNLFSKEEIYYYLIVYLVLFLSVCFVFQYVCFLSSIASKVSVENVCYEKRCFDVTHRDK